MVKLGSTVKDSISGFEGIAVSRTEYLYGCVHIGVEPMRLKEDGTTLEMKYFDEQRLDGASAAETGGPGDVPPARSVPPPREAR